MKNILRFTLLSIALPVFSMEPPQEPENSVIIFLGNSGAGKSTLANTQLHIFETPFEASDDADSVTSEMSHKKSLHRGWSVIDTPGLNDLRDTGKVSLMEQEILAALNLKDRLYKLIFVFAPSKAGGRIQWQDIETLKCILHHIEGTPPYSIIVNTCEYDDNMREAYQYAFKMVVNRNLSVGRAVHPPENFLFIKRGIDPKSKKMLREFIRNMSSCKLSKILSDRFMTEAERKEMLAQLNDRNAAFDAFMKEYEESKLQKARNKYYLKKASLAIFLTGAFVLYFWANS